MNNNRKKEMSYIKMKKNIIIYFYTKHSLFYYVF